MLEDNKKEPPCCAPAEPVEEADLRGCSSGCTPDQTLAEIKPSYIAGAVSSQAGDVPVVATKLCFADNVGALRVRWGFGRSSYRVPPGLYAIGNPTAKSGVLVSANYKLSFDHLRSRMDSRSAWILVLDTRGINVWCAAGKGTFGTDEIVKRVKEARLDEIVTHNSLIVPQLGATGVAAHEVKRRCGFNVIYGPVRANDLPEFIDSECTATPEMRRVRFGILDRATLIPTELVGGFKYALILAALFFVLAGLGRDGYSTSRLLSDGILIGLLIIGAFVISAVLAPLLLPWLPGRPFSIKGLWIGIIGAIAVWYLVSTGRDVPLGVFTGIAWLLISIAVTSMVALNFTGSSTYTSLSGVRREMKYAIPLISFAGISGMVLWIVGRFF